MLFKTTELANDQKVTYSPYATFAFILKEMMLIFILLSTLTSLVISYSQVYVAGFVNCF